MKNLSNRDDWETPPHLFKIYNDEFRFKLDVAASKENALCKKYFTEKDNALFQDWGSGPVWCNPPYGRGVKDAFIHKAYTQSQRGCTTVMLLPVKTDTKAFHKYIWDAENHCPLEGIDLRFLAERPSFLLDGKIPLGSDGKPMGGRQPHMIVVFWGYGERNPE